jgi:hypothetical protein
LAVEARSGLRSRWQSVIESPWNSTRGPIPGLAGTRELEGPRVFDGAVSGRAAAAARKPRRSRGEEVGIAPS